MVKGRLQGLAIAAILLASAAAGADSLILAEHGRPADCAIVVLQAADEAVRHAAEELRDFTDRTTGVKLPIAIDAQSAALPAKAIVLEVVDEKEGTDGFRLKAKDGRLHVIGENGRGVMYGVYELLERYAGCRWYAPWHTVAPKRDRSAVQS